MVSFGEFNPLSNFYPAVFTYNGTHYNHTEQFIQARKAEFCNDNESLNEIMSTTSALKCKELGHSVKNCNPHEWNKKAKELCFPVILCKFQQNGGLAAFLKTREIKPCLNAAMTLLGEMAYPFPALIVLRPTNTNIKAYRVKCWKKSVPFSNQHHQFMWNQLRVETTLWTENTNMWKWHFIMINFCTYHDHDCGDSALKTYCLHFDIGVNYPSVF